MDERLKQRLVGAVVLVSLAVIFVPMILDERDRDLGEPGSNLPPAPDFETQERIRPIELPPPLPAPEAPPGEAGSGDAAGGAADPASAPASEPAAETPSPPAAPEEKAAPTRDAPPAGPEPAPPTSAAEPAAAAASGWAVQVGSFGSEKNARALAARLRQAGYQAYVSRTEKAGRPFFRVRVGPEPERERAERLKAKLDAFLGQKTIVLREEGTAG